MEELEAAARWGLPPDDTYWMLPRETRALMVAFNRLDHLMTNVNQYDQMPKRK